MKGQLRRYSPALSLVMIAPIPYIANHGSQLSFWVQSLPSPLISLFSIALIIIRLLNALKDDFAVIDPVCQIGLTRARNSRLLTGLRSIA